MFNKIIPDQDEIFNELLQIDENNFPAYLQKLSGNGVAYRCRFNMLNGKLRGRFEKYYDDNCRRLQILCNFNEKGLLHGRVFIYKPDGKIWLEADFNNGKYLVPDTSMPF